MSNSFLKRFADLIKVLCLIALPILFFVFLSLCSTAYGYYVSRHLGIAFSKIFYGRLGIPVFIILVIAMITLFILFCTAVYVTSDSTPTHFMKFIHNIEFLYFTVLIISFVPCCYLFLVGTFNASKYFDYGLLLGISLLICPALVVLSGLLWISSFLYRIKNKVLSKTTYWLQFFKCYTINKRIGFFVLITVFGLLILTIQALFSRNIFLLIICNVALGLLTFLTLFLIQIWEIRFCITNPSVLIDRTGDIPYLKELLPIAKGLENLKISYELALDEKIKSERFKTELITNVSHDIKTPLTSIINYVDLLKKLKIQNIQFDEYIAILDKKSFRLKMLIEDLLEASKAGTGNVSVNKEKIDLCEMTGQIAGEFDELFEKKELQLVFKTSTEKVLVFADGRHLWRVMENIFSNTAKYAMEGTRVYAEINETFEKVIFTLRNISDEPLVDSSDDLTQQFIRGDKSRGSDGSGLGLYIAKSLAQLMDIDFSVETRGDLFEVKMEINI